MQKNKTSFSAIVLGLCFLLTACAAAQPKLSTILTKTVSPSGSPTPVQSVAATTVPILSCQVSHGTTEQVKFRSPVMRETLTFTVYLPPCYDANLSGGYPVLYLLHGQNMDDTFWPSIGITEAADNAIRAGQPAFIMVFPYEVHNFDPVPESKFGDAVMDDLIPYVESHYNACTLRVCRAIGGLSRGGGWAIHLGLTHLDMFSSIGAHSPGWFSGDLYRVQNLLVTHTPSDFPRIYIDRGDQDYLRDSIDLYEKNLTATGMAHVYKISPGIHDEAYWQSQVPTYIAWYVQGFAGLN